VLSARNAHLAAQPRLFLRLRSSKTIVAVERAAGELYDRASTHEDDRRRAG
jgi:hypothetical protein